MKQVISVSLGSSTGDFEREIQMGGETVHLVREGVDGDMERAKQRIRELDGNVDAIGLGGIDVYLYVAGKQFIVGDGMKLVEQAKITPVVDGSGLKDTLEREAVQDLVRRGLIVGAASGSPLSGGDGVGERSNILMVGAMDRFGMAEAFIEAGCKCVFGDLIFHIGIDYPYTTLAELDEFAEKTRSRLLTVPFHMLYPTGDKQLERKPDPRFVKYYEQADVIAGDRHLIRRHMPDTLPGKGILTTTTRPSTIDEYRAAGVKWVYTTTPAMDGVSGGTNLMEAALIAVLGKPAGEVTRDDYRAAIKDFGWHGSFQELKER